MSPKDTCPICGGPMDEEPYEIRKDFVCTDCEKRMRFLYPIEYWPNAHPCEKRRPSLSHILPEEKLKSREKADMIDELRKLPLNQADPHPGRSYTLDRMRALDLAEFKQQYADLPRLRRQLKENYDDYDNVFTIEAIYNEKMQLTLEDPDPRLCKYRHRFTVSGVTRLGKFQPGDFCIVLHEGQELECDILDVAQRKRWLPSQIARGENHEKYLHWIATEGYPGNIVISLESPLLSSGDLILMDD